MERAIIHIDGDGFFASCEVSLNPKLKGKPVVTGQERGIATAMSQEAKKLGISRGMPIYQIKKFYPEAVVVNSNYHTYTIFAQRMYNIVRRYTNQVEEYSIDECFADITGLETSTTSYSDIARSMQEALNTELGMTFSLGLGPTKVIAKVASKWNKPNGFTVIRPEDIPEFLREMLVGKIWGIGPSQSQYLTSIGIKTALNLIQKPEPWITRTQHKHIRELWHELHGTPVYKVRAKHTAQASIQKTRTFTQPSFEKEFIFSELSRNVESACQKARAQRLTTKRVYYFLKTQEFRYHRFEIPLTVASVSPHVILTEIRRTFDSVYRPETLYRSTGVTLSELQPANLSQNDLFGEVVKNEGWNEIYKIVDIIDRRYGTHTMRLASSSRAWKSRGYRSERHLKIPYMGEVV